LPSWPENYRGRVPEGSQYLDTASAPSCPDGLDLGLSRWLLAGASVALKAMEHAAYTKEDIVDVLNVGIDELIR
jgi:hypothetical protein